MSLEKLFSVLARHVSSVRSLAAKPSIRVMLPLVGARAVYRIGLLSAGIILLTVWGEDEFSGYAIAMGGFKVLSFITTLGVEKSALKLIPRARYTGRQLTTLFVLLPVAISVVCAGWVLWFGSVSQYPTLMVPAGGLAICSGLNQVLVGLHRVHGHPYRDMVNYLLLSASVVVAVLGALVWQLGPVGVLSIMFGSVLVANIALGSTLPLVPVRRIRKPLVWSSVRASVLMSAYEIAGSAIISVGFVLIGQSDFRSQAGYMYVVLEGSAFLMAGFGYVLRIFQPRISIYMHRGESAALMFNRAVSWLKVLLIAGPPYLAVVAVGGFAWESISGRPAGSVLIFLLYTSSVPFFLLMGTVNYLLENHTDKSFASAAAGSMAGMIGAGLVSWAIVPMTGALGAVLSWALADIIHAATILLIFRLTRPGSIDSPIEAAQPTPVAARRRPDNI